MNRRPRTDNQLEFADSLQCLKHLSPEWIYSRVGLSVQIDRIDNLADDKLIEVDDLLEMSGSRLIISGLNRKRSGVIGVDGLSHRE